MDVIERKKFSEINLEDDFFNSLKDDYPGFDIWFNKKSKKDESAFILDDNGIQGFLYLKEENDDDTSIIPNLRKQRRLKVGTFKINAHGTKLGERFIKIIIDEMFKKSYKEAYVTIFKKHDSLISLLLKYGFEHYGIKNSKAGIEDVYFKYSQKVYEDIFLDYPKINIKNNKKFMLSIFPKYHTRMFPNSQLKTEKDHVVEDTAFTNSIQKIYLSGANLSAYEKGDIIVIYRTADKGKKAEYSSVATSICVINQIKHISEFKDYNEFYKYCAKHSVFDESELKCFWKTKKYKYLVKMLYSIALNKRIIRRKLIEEVGIDREQRWVAVQLSDKKFQKILELGEVDESFIID
ncbi:hypothetical protein GTH52_01110 [Clostridium tyrobutyricum]|uniref:Lj965 prophage protein n=1 Tax=Clostridium tyrobutyricum DIVETGP TaxID=1408889 RepID=W6NKS1_CLOTY|nr:hypothetical protein [Clostridium tyrobutyricum]AND85555.1 hypothetical protein CTK_C23070 [Clostridium tyrobutyricum]ANP70086.1 hypothetical protein BA182_10445 [Clostridium tyrobutyricum]MBV4434431.1 hypothetical protein [Clostridium tyrobutyricum]QNB65554.1 hypothetical protein GTH52_01110 [Clostridium tyrobutyricum]CDL92457.1 Lj965 prophage protein [Clostridium tyrobutyricum DIVETGP]